MSSRPTPHAREFLHHRRRGALDGRARDSRDPTPTVGHTSRQTPFSFCRRARMKLTRGRGIQPAFDAGESIATSAGPCGEIDMAQLGHDPAHPRHPWSWLPGKMRWLLHTARGALSDDYHVFRRLVTPRITGARRRLSPTPAQLPQARAGCSIPHVFDPQPRGRRQLARQSRWDHGFPADSLVVTYGSMASHRRAGSLEVTRPPGPS